MVAVNCSLRAGFTGIGEIFLTYSPRHYNSSICTLAKVDSRESKSLVPFTPKGKFLLQPVDARLEFLVASTKSVVDVHSQNSPWPSSDFVSQHPHAWIPWRFLKVKSMQLLGQRLIPKERGIHEPVG